MKIRTRSLLICPLLILVLGVVNVSASTTQFVDGVGFVEKEGGLLKLSFADGGSAYTHGLDAESHLLVSPSPGGTKDSVVCTGSRDKHFEVIVARAFDDEDRSSLLTDRMKQAVYDASEFMDSEARGTDPARWARLKVLCDSTGEVIVNQAVLPTSKTSDSASSIIGDLRGLGYTNTSAKYLVFYDDCVSIDCVSGGGFGTINRDDRASSKNFNNRGPDWAVDLGGPLGTYPDWGTLLHEAGHNMGAVQLSAPNSSGYNQEDANGFHCNDGEDIMCYDDGGDTSQYDPLVCQIQRFDCNGDDYFNPAPPAGSYLASHWNLAASYNAFIQHAEPAAAGSGPGKGKR